MIFLEPKYDPRRELFLYWDGSKWVDIGGVAQIQSNLAELDSSKPDFVKGKDIAQLGYDNTKIADNPLTSTNGQTAIDELVERGNATQDSLDTVIEMAVTHYQFYPILTVGTDVYTNVYAGWDLNAEVVNLLRTVKSTKNGADYSEDYAFALKSDIVGAEISFEDSESDNLPSLDPETIATKMQEFYSLCKWFKNNMVVKVNWWPRMVLAFMQNGNTIAALNSTTGFAIEPLTEADRNGWTITLDNSEQGGEGAQGVLRLVYNSDTDWYVEGKAWHEGDFHTVLQYSTDVPGYEMVGDFDGNGGVISDMNGDIANSSVAKVIYPESQFTVDFRKLLDDLTVTTISNNVLKGINTFLYPPQVPTPYSANDATNKAYVDAAIAAALGN